MNLDKPLLSFDIESTGLDPVKDKIIDLAGIKLFPSGKREERSFRLDPGMHIPEDATRVCGISDDDVKGFPSFGEIAPVIFKFFDGCAVTGYNINKFDVPLLSAEFSRVGVNWPTADTIVIDAYAIVVMQEARDLSWALSHYVNRPLENAHTATADAMAALEVALAQGDKFKCESLKDLDALQRDPSWVDKQGKFKRSNGNIALTFGKHDGVPLSKIPSGYLKWMLGSDFSQDVLDIVKEEVARRIAR